MSDTGIKHRCHDCDRKFKTVKTLKTHMKHFHNNNATGSNDGDYNVVQSDGQLHSDEDSKQSQPSSKEYDSDDSTFTFIDAILKTNNITVVAKLLNENEELVDTIFDTVDRATINQHSEDEDTQPSQVPN